MNKVFFCADLHISHKNILIHQNDRVKDLNLIDEYDIEGHDKYIIDTWNQQVSRGDHVYVLGDFILANKQRSLQILNILKSNGCKIHLIVGNHDKSTKNMNNMFETIDYIKVAHFSKNEFDFLDDNFDVVMCHYPMKSWPNKTRGSMMLYGHVHWNAPWIDDSDDLTLNVGFDNPLCGYKLFTLEQVYNIYKKKLNKLTPKEYIQKVSEENNFFIR